MKTLKNIRLLILIIFAGTILPMQSLGQQTTRKIETGSFSGVDASGIFNVYLSVSEEHSVVVEAEQENIEKTDISVRRGILNVRFTGSIRKADLINVYVSSPEFTYLKSSGATTLRSENLLKSPYLELESSGASNLNLELDTEELTSDIGGATTATLTGRAASHDLSLSGASVLRALELETSSTIADINGASTAHVHAKDYLEADVNGTSSLTYKDNPLTKKFNTSGLSSIRQANGEDNGSASSQDTVRVRVGEREIVVVEGDGPAGVSFRKRSKRNFEGNWGGFELGINGYLTPDNKLELDDEYNFLDLKYEKSVAVNINAFEQSLNLIGNQLGLVTGLGLAWNNYRFSNNVVPVHTPDGIGVEEPNPEYSYRKSKLTVLYLRVPLLLEFQTRGHSSNQFHISAGVHAGVRLRSHTKQVYDIDGEKNKDKTYEDFHLRPFRFDATAQIGWGWINLFANYSLNSMFKDDKGPELYPFTVGLRIISW